MKISVIIPVYNVDKFLSECLESVINQTYNNIEIVLIDDGSTDESGKICDEYGAKDKRIKVIHQKNMGVSIARNTGIKLAKGDYITFVDSDDIINPKYIELLSSHANNNTLSMGNILLFDKKIVDRPVKKDFIILRKDFIKLSELFLLNSPCCRLYNLNIIRSNHLLFKEDLSLGEDLLFNLEYLKYIDKIFFINQDLYYYRQFYNDSLSSKYNDKMMQIQFMLFDKYTDFFKNSIMEKQQCTIFDTQRFSMIISIVQNEFSNGKKSFFGRYMSCQKKLSDKKMKDRMKSIKYPKQKLDYFLFSCHLLIGYKIVNKIRRWWKYVFSPKNNK